MCVQEYAAIFSGAGNDPGEKSLEDKFFEKEVSCPLLLTLPDRHNGGCVEPVEIHAVYHCLSQHFYCCVNIPTMQATVLSIIHPL